MKIVIFSAEKQWKGKIEMLEVVVNQTQRKPQVLIVVCAWCQKQRVLGPDFNFYWIENKSSQNDDQVSHTICPTCKAKMAEQMHLIPLTRKNSPSL